MSRAQLLQLGLTPAGIVRALEAGRLHVEHRGVYAVGHAAHTHRGRLIAAVLACGPDSALSHQPAGAVHGLMRWDGRPHVTAPRARGPHPGIVVHRSRRLAPDAVVEVDGIPVTSWARTIIDLADVLPVARVVRLLEQAVMQGIYDHDELTAARERHPGRRGSRRLAAAVAQGHHRSPQRTRSPLEERFLDLVRSAQPPLPAVRCNEHVESWGELIEVDALFAEQRLAVELDGRRFHGHAGARARDAERDVLLAAAGYRVLRLAWDDVVHSRQATIRRLRRALTPH